MIPDRCLSLKTDLNADNQSEVENIGILGGFLHECSTNSISLDGIISLLENSNCGESANKSSMHEDRFKSDLASPLSRNSSVQSTTESCSVENSGSSVRLASVTSWDKAELCVICSDASTGKHYGVIACEGCKGFFKRTVRKNLSYNCRESGHCHILEKSRNRCQACRFRKCIDKGMRVEAVQKERPRKQHRKQMMEAHKDGLSIAQLIKADRLYPMVSGEDDGNVVMVTGVEDLCSVLNEQLFDLVAWAKAVPGFEELSRGEQLSLINKGWADILACTMAHRTASMATDSTANQEMNLRLSGRHSLDISSAQLTPDWFLLLQRFLNRLVLPWRLLRPDHTEAACLRALLLFDPGMPQYQRDRTPVETTRSSILDLLNNHHTAGSKRLGRLLLLLTAVRQCSLLLSARLAATISCRGDRYPLLAELLHSSGHESPPIT